MSPVPPLFAKGDAVRIKRTVETPYGDKVGVVKEVHRHDGVLVELGGELASARFQPAVLAHAAPADVPAEVWRMIKPPEPVRHDPEPDPVHYLVIALRVPSDDIGQIDFTDTIEVLDYLAERHSELSIDFSDNDYPSPPY